MYGWLWRKLPGRVPEKVTAATLLLVAALALLFFVIFPWTEPRLPWNDVTVNSPSIGQTNPSVPSISGTPTASP